MLGGSGQCFRRFGSGFVGRPTWEELRAGARPPLPLERAEPGEWQHGRQYLASSSSELYFGRRWHLLSRALLTRLTCSLSGPASCAVLHGAPTGPEFELAGSLPDACVGELPLQVSEAHCECGLPLDVQGRPRPCVPRRRCHSGFNAMFRDMNIAVVATDHRAIEVLASGLPLHHGVQLVVDITIRCAHTANAATTNRAVLQVARAQKATNFSWGPLPFGCGRRGDGRAME